MNTAASPCTEKSGINFQITTSNADNLRAGQQFLRIRERIKDVLKDFGERLYQTHPDDAKRWEFYAVFKARIKEESFFIPSHLSYEGGREAIEFL